MYLLFEDYNMDIPGFAGTKHDIFLIDNQDGTFTADSIQKNEKYLITDLIKDLNRKFNIQLTYSWNDEWIISF